MKMKIFLNLKVFSLLVFVGSCASVTKQPSHTKILSASQEDTLGGTGTSSADIRSMAERMAREIASIGFGDKNKTIKIALTKIDNQTRFPINPNLLKDRLLADLVEFSINTNLKFTENQDNADLFLSARITALSKGSREGVSDYLLYTFKMIDHEGTVLWMGTYETKKQGQTGVMYR